MVLEAIVGLVVLTMVAAVVPFYLLLTMMERLSKTIEEKKSAKNGRSPSALINRSAAVTAPIFWESEQSPLAYNMEFSVFEAVNGGRDPSATVDEVRATESVDRHDLCLSKKASKLS